MPPFFGRAANEICGCYWVEPGSYLRRYLPQTELTSHTKITPVCFSTHLQQKFSNSNDVPIKEIRYVFPLYDGVSVGGYKIQYGDKVLEGVVKQKDEARKTYQAAVDRGETASLLESLPSGIFGVTIGNVPAKTDIFVSIDYLGELKHDAAIDGLRYSLPTSVCPRYGDYPNQVTHTPIVVKDGIKVVVDIDMGKSAIRKIQSPSHPIAISMGNTSTESTATAFQPSKGSASFTRGSADLGVDFVLQLLIDDISKPQAIIQKHTTVDSRAIMATVVPKFNLPLIAPEIVFIADQSGSMSGDSNIALKAALNVFLKSLPFGAHFNICAFGSSYKYIFDKSQPYNEANLKQAMAFVDTFEAQYGGTEMLEPVKQAFDKALGDLPLEIMLLTDGEIWGEQALFQLIEQKLHVDHLDARVFTLGIGSGVSHTLVEGVARAGNGFSQFIVNNEEVDTKIVRMLRASLFVHTKDYTLEVNFDDGEDASDDFELVEKLDAQLVIEDKPEKPAVATTFFDESAKLDDPIQSGDRYAHLPVITTPSILQGPSRIPPLFPYNRTSLYFILGPDAPQKKVQSVTLRAIAPSGPLQLTIPVTATEDGTAVHQLAARKIIQELEDGRGWIQEGKTADGSAIKENFKSRLPELAEREAVRLGELYDVANRWCSFVAVDTSSLEIGPDENTQDAVPGAARAARSMQVKKRTVRARAAVAMPPPPPTREVDSELDEDEDMGFGLFDDGSPLPSPPAPAAVMPRMSPAAAEPSLFGCSSNSTQSSQVFASPALMPQFAGGSLFGAKPSSTNTAVAGRGLGSTQTPSSQPSGGLIGNASTSPVFRAANASPSGTNKNASSLFASQSIPNSKDTVSGGIGFANTNNSYAPAALAQSLHGISYSSSLKSSAPSGSARPPESTMSTPPKTPTERLRAIIKAQTFSGAWEWDETLMTLLELDSEKTSSLVQTDQFATALVLVYLDTRMADKRDVWELVADKANAWMKAGLDDAAIQALVTDASKLIP